MGLDVGEETTASFCAAVERASTIVWNGPVGVFEFENFARGSRAVLDSIVMATEKGATSIIGRLDRVPFNAHTILFNTHPPTTRGRGHCHLCREVWAGRQGEPREHRGRGQPGAAGRQATAWSGGPH